MTNHPLDPPEIIFDFEDDNARKLYGGPEGFAPATKYSAGYDLRIMYNQGIQVPATYQVSLGIRLAIPNGWAGIIAPRSSLWQRHGVIMANGIGIIDSDYRGVLQALLWVPQNHPEINYIVRGERIAQIMFVPIHMAGALHVGAGNLGETDRGDGGFGSTGI